MEEDMIRCPKCNSENVLIENNKVVRCGNCEGSKLPIEEENAK